MMRKCLISFALLFIIAFPLILNMDFVLNLWLVDVPQYTAIFSKLILCFFLIEALSAPLWMFVQATGRIRNYQILMGILIFLNFPLAYLVLKYGFQVYYVWIVRIIVNVIVFSVRCIYMKNNYEFPLNQYCIKVLFPITTVTIISIPCSILVWNIIDGYWPQFLLSCLFTVMFTLTVIYIGGLTHNEKKFVAELVRKKIRRQ